MVRNGKPRTRRYGVEKKQGIFRKLPTTFVARAAMNLTQFRIVDSCAAPVSPFYGIGNGARNRGAPADTWPRRILRDIKKI
jgi:hypothetical protein